MLLYQETKIAQIAVKTASGLTRREAIQNIFMQGTAFGSLICTSVMDKLAKMFYKDDKLLYTYKSEVKVPVLGMVDDVLCVAKCGSEAVVSNSNN